MGTPAEQSFPFWFAGIRWDEKARKAEAAQEKKTRKARGSAYPDGEGGHEEVGDD